MIRCVSDWDTECVEVAMNFAKYLGDLQRELVGYIENKQLSEAFALSSSYDDALVSMTTILAGHADPDRVQELDDTKWQCEAERKFQVLAAEMLLKAGAGNGQDGGN